MLNKKISVICIDCDSQYIDDTLGNQTYTNLEVVETQTGKDFFEDVINYIEDTDSEYISFLEPEHLFENEKIEFQAGILESVAGLGVTFVGRNIIDKEKTILAHPDALYEDFFNKNYIDGTAILEYFLKYGKNVFGTLSEIMINKKNISLSIDKYKKYSQLDSDIQKCILMLSFMINQNLAIKSKTLVSKYISLFDKNELKVKFDLFKNYVNDFLHDSDPIFAENEYRGLSVEQDYLLGNENEINYNLKKEITIFYTDKGEYYNLIPIAKEAEKRGYTVKATTDINEKAEIGFYCQHVCKPENSKFSAILLHDMAQGHNRWPNLWELERWNIFDLGIVPGNNWKERWEDCAFEYYLHPRCGAYALGYPKSDIAMSLELMDRVKELKKKFNFKYDFSVLYAPSWENDEKEDDFVRALASLNVNLLIKQAHWNDDYDFVNVNINKMRKMHEGKYDNVYYIEPEESIMTALAMCDLVVSDESSVMTEALLYGKPSIAVIDWLIPDTNPSRFACVPFDYVYKCKRVELREYVEKIINNKMGSMKKESDAEIFYNNIGRVNKDIMDAVEYYGFKKASDDFLKWKMNSKYMPITFWN